MTARMLKQLAYLALCEAQASTSRQAAEHCGALVEQLDAAARRAGWRGDYGQAFEPCHIAGNEPCRGTPAPNPTKYHPNPQAQAI